MTQPTQPEIPPVDPGNPFVDKFPAVLSTKVAQTPNGQLVAMTMRVANGTLTALLTRDEAKAWAAQLDAAADGASPLIVAGPGTPLPPPPGPSNGLNGHRPTGGN